jgi:hypothetical protein
MFNMLIEKYHDVKRVHSTARIKSVHESGLLWIKVTLRQLKLFIIFIIPRRIILYASCKTDIE